MSTQSHHLLSQPGNPGSSIFDRWRIVTVSTGTGDLYRTARVHAGRALISVSRHLSRAGARLIGHPSASELVERPPLRLVAGRPAYLFDCRHHR